MVIRCIVTGGAGFIGSHLIERLLHDGHEVVCIDNYDRYYQKQIKMENISPFFENPNFTCIEDDIQKSASLRDFFEGADYVFHQAAQAGVQISITNPEKSHDTNATGTLKVLIAARDAGVKKVINASSSSVYGKVKYLPFDEEHPTIPISPYGVSKLSSEHYCRVFEEIYGLNTISLRYFTVYGPRMRPDLAIHIFTQKAMAGEDIEIFGDGSKTRDYTYIDSAVEANVLAMKRGSGPFNIGGGHQISITSLADAINALHGGRSEIIYLPAKKGDAEHTLANSNKAKKELGLSFNFTLEEGLKRYKQWVTSRYQ